MVGAAYTLRHTLWALTHPQNPYVLTPDGRIIEKESAVTCLPHFSAESPNRWQDGPEMDVPAGTFRQQLDQMTAAYHYVWLTDGDWINLVPAEWAKDKNYVFNLRIPGRVVESRDSKRATSSNDWQKEHNISLGMLLCGLVNTGPPPDWVVDPIILTSPTMRESANAHYTVYGKGVWYATVSQTRSELSKIMDGWSITYSAGQE
jgi:hypothetical protein